MISDLNFVSGITCGPINDVLHGSVQCSEGDGYNSVCEFECDPGFELTGSRTRTCLDTKQWSGGGSSL